MFPLTINLLPSNTKTWSKTTYSPQVWTLLPTDISNYYLSFPTKRMVKMYLIVASDCNLTVEHILWGIHKLWWSWCYDDNDDAPGHHSCLEFGTHTVRTTSNKSLDHPSRMWKCWQMSTRLLSFKPSFWAVKMLQAVYKAAVKVGALKLFSASINITTCSFSHVWNFFVSSIWFVITW